MSTTRTKILSFVMALLMIFGTFAPCLAIADDDTDTPVPESTPPAIITVVDGENEGGAEEQPIEVQEQINVSGEEPADSSKTTIHIVTGFDIAYAEETEEQLPLFSIAVDEGTEYDNIGFPKTVKGYVDGAEELSEIVVIEWKISSNSFRNVPDGYSVCVPTFDGDTVYIIDGIDVPYGIISFMQQTSNDANTIQNNDIEETDSQQSTVVSNETENVIPVNETEDSELNDVQNVINNSEGQSENQQSEAQVNNDEDKDKIVVTGFYIDKNVDIVDEELYASLAKKFEILMVGITIPDNYEIDNVWLPKSILAYINDQKEPTRIYIESWEQTHEFDDAFPSNYIVIIPIFSDEYTIEENVNLPYGVLVKEKAGSTSLRAAKGVGGTSNVKSVGAGQTIETATSNATALFQASGSASGSSYSDVTTQLHYYNDTDGQHVLYCMQHRVSGVSGTYTVVTLENLNGHGNPAISGLDAEIIKGLKIILQNAYPSTTISGLDADYARQATQMVLRCFMRIYEVGQEGTNGTWNNAFTLGLRSQTKAQRLATLKGETEAQLKTRFATYTPSKNRNYNDKTSAYMAHLLYLAFHGSIFVPSISANDVTLTWSTTNNRFEGSVTVNNNTNGTLTYTTPSGFTITKNGNTLTITAGRDKANTSNTTVSLSSTDTRGEGNIFGFYPSSKRQTTYGFGTNPVPVSGSFKINVGALPEGYLAIKKVSANASAVNGNSYYSLSGAVYTVYTGANKTGTNKGSITTDANGNGTTSLTLAPGTYYLHETTAPTGYQLNDTDYQFTIAGGQTLVLSGASGTNTTDNKYNVGILKDNPKGYIKLTKTSSNTGITNNNSNYSLSGAVYGIYTDSACTTEALAANGTSSRMTTNASGYVESKWLNYGTYYVKEITASAGYTLDTNTYTVTVNATTPIITVTSNEAPITGSVTIVKVSGNTTVTNGNSNYSLAGGVYEIKQGNTVKGTLTTNANGTANTVSGLPLGSYTLTEKTAPPGFIRNTTSYTFTITGSALKTITSSDTAILSDSPILATVNITKVSGDTNVTSGNNNYSLAGAVYKIVGNNKTYTFPATDANGNAQLTNIPLGSYTLSEVTPPPGYKANTSTYTIAITSSNTTYNITGASVGVLSDTPITGSVKITKSSGDTSVTNGNSNYSLAGAVYKLVGNGKTFTFPATNASGVAQLTGLPLGSYTLSEVTPPTGYQPNTTTYTVNVTNDTTINLTASNTDALKDMPILGQIKIKKASAVPSITNGNNCYSLTGAEYELYKADGTYVATLVTNANGEATQTGLALGSYYIVETKSSQGYAVSNGRKEFTLTSADLETFSGGIFNETPLNDPIAALVYKVDADTGARVPQGGASLAGAQFTVKYYDALYDTVPASASPKYTWVFATDEDGFVAFLEMYKISGPALPVNENGAPCVPVGTITIQETQAPAGYLINNTMYTYKIDSENGMLVAQYPSIEINETVKKGRFTIEKYKMDTKDGSVAIETAQTNAELEQGAIFQVIASDGTIVDTLTTDANGRATTIELPYDTYTIHQISGETGYFFIGDATVSITENGENKLYKLYNDRKYAALHVIKKDAETGNVIAVAGVTFEIYDSNNQKVVLDGQSSFTTDANGEFTTPKRLPYGSYTLKETIAPEGYALPTSSIPFVINDATYGTDGIVTKEAFDSKASCEINLYKTGLICTGFETVTENGYQVTRPKFEEGFLTGVVFSLYAKTDILNNNGTVKYHAGELVMDNVTTEADGHAHFRGLQSGTYEVRETSTLNGYLLLSEPIEVTCDLGDAQEIVVEPVGPIYNELKSVEIKFLKQKQIFSVSNGSGSYSYVAASGFTFGLYSGETLTLIGSGTTYTLPANTLIATAVSDSNGQVNFAGYYPAGNYYVKELEVQNDAYMLDDATYPISITMTNAAPQTVVIDNTSTPIHNDLYKANIKVVKKDAETGNVIPLAGATFEIRNSNDILVDTVVTDATGHAETSIALPYGTYSIKETVPPEGYVLDSTPNNILIDSTTVETDEAVEYVEYVANDTRIKGKITVVKKGLALTVANVEAENGFQVTKLAYTEEFLPNVKIDLYAVEDIVFLGEVKYAAGTKVTSGTTTSDGRLEFDELYLGSYELRETESASDVYVLPSQNEQVTLTSTNNTIDVVERTVNMNNGVRDVEISFVKKVPSVSTTTNGENVTTTISANHSDFIAATEGFVFGLYNSTAIEMYNNNGTIPANTLLATATIGQNGVVSFNQKLPHGTYYIKEIAFPEKYAALTGNIDGFTIIPDDLTQDLIEISLGDVYNELITVDMSIYKYDEDTEAPLGTALFEIKDNDTGVVLFRGRTNDSGMLGPVAIYPGSFTLTELEAPEDYDIAEPITFTVTPEGKVMVGETEIQNGQFNIPDEYINIPNVVLPRTGSKAALWLTIGGGIAVAAGIAVFIIVGKKKKDDDEE